MMERTHDVSVCDSSLVELEAWIEAARLGDRDALGRALVAVRDYLLLVANERLEPALKVKGNASDLVQDTFLRAQRGVQSFRGRTAGEWRQWLRKILIRNIAQDRRRFLATAKRLVKREVTIPEQMPLESAAYLETPSRDLALRELKAALLDGLDRLPERHRAVVIWRQREGLSFEEIGSRMDTSAEAARKLWTRALARLRKELGPGHDSR
jgi:RNA polymerase sigma-70 factor (ECF subfamily)